MKTNDPDIFIEVFLMDLSIPFDGPSKPKEKALRHNCTHTSSSWYRDHDVHKFMTEIGADKRNLRLLLNIRLARRQHLDRTSSAHRVTLTELRYRSITSLSIQHTPFPHTSKYIQTHPIDTPSTYRHSLYKMPASFMTLPYELREQILFSVVQARGTIQLQFPLWGDKDVFVLPIAQVCKDLREEVVQVLYRANVFVWLIDPEQVRVN
jgi:hypothetical protein